MYGMVSSLRSTMSEESSSWRWRRALASLSSSACVAAWIAVVEAGALALVASAAAARRRGRVRLRRSLGTTDSQHEEPETTNPNEAHVSEIISILSRGNGRATNRSTQTCAMRRA